MERLDHGRVLSLAMSCLIAVVLAPPSGMDARAAELVATIAPAEMEFLLGELVRIQPPERLRELSGFGARQLELGGGFYGMLPDQLADPDNIPLPMDEAGRHEAAVRLVQQRNENLAALREINPDYALTFGDESLPEFLDRIEPEDPSTQQPPTTLSLKLDISALTGLFAALEDGEIDTDEAAALANLPSNQAMLQHRRNLGYVPEPLPDTESLAEMIRIAGSADPLDRLWCWINPQNAFGYADLASNVEGYSRLLSGFETHGELLASAVLGQIGAYTPVDLRFDGHFAFTVGWAIRGWTTPEMAGLNLEQVKNDWELLFGTLVEETYHQLQLELCPTSGGGPAREFADLVAFQSDDPRYARLYEIITYTVLEGVANFVRGKFAAADLPDKAQAGADLLARFVVQVVERGDEDSADALVSEGLKGNGPLYGLGWKLASLIEEKDGKRAIGELQKSGPTRLFLRGTALAAESGAPLVGQEVIAAVEALETRLAP